MSEEKKSVSAGIRTTPRESVVVNRVVRTTPRENVVVGRVIRTTPRENVKVNQIIRPATTSTPKTAVPVVQERPVREKPTKPPVDLKVTLADQLQARLAGAAERGDESLSRQITAAAQAGLDNELTRAEVKRLKRSKSGKFASEIKLARKALEKARELKSPDDVEAKAEEVLKHAQAASRLDKERRSEQDILELIGTSTNELDGLYIKAFTAVTVAPTEHGVVLERKMTRGHSAPRSFRTMNVRGRIVEALQLGHDIPVCYEVRQISSSDPVDPPNARIIYRRGEEYGAHPFLFFPDDRYLMIEHEPSGDVRLMGKGQVALMSREEDWLGWTYYPYSQDRGFVRSDPLVGSFRDGLCEPEDLPAQKPVMVTPLMAFVHEFGVVRCAYLTYLADNGAVEIVEVNCGQEALSGEWLDVVRGFIPYGIKCSLDQCLPAEACVS